MRESDHYSQSHVICIDQCLPFEESRTKRTATRSDVGNVRLVSSPCKSARDEAK